MASVGDINTITLPDGNTYEIRDNKNAEDIAELQEQKLGKYYEMDSSDGKLVPYTWKAPIAIYKDFIWTDGENVYYSSGSSQYVFDKSTLIWDNKDWIELNNFSGYNVWTDGENVYYSNGSAHYILDKLTSTWETKTWIGLTNFDGMYVWTDGENVYYSDGSDEQQYVLNKSTSTWETKIWSSYENPYKSDIWTDGENIYSSDEEEQYVLNKLTSTWNPKTWIGLTDFSASGVWSDGENIYYSNGSSQYILDKSTSTWETKTWTGLNPNGAYIWTCNNKCYHSYKLNHYILDSSTSTWSEIDLFGPYGINGRCVWTDGENYYYSDYLTHYVLDESTSIWNEKTWNSPAYFYGYNVWTDGENVYYSSGSSQYVFDKTNSTWISKSWNGLNSFDGMYVWTYKEDIYYSYSGNQYVLNKSTSEWVEKIWSGVDNLSGSRIWTDGKNIYYSNSSSKQYVLDQQTMTWSQKTWNGYNNIYGNCVWSTGNNIYYSNDSYQYILDKSTSTWSEKSWIGCTSFSGTNVWKHKDSIYFNSSTSSPFGQYLIRFADQVLIGQNGEWTKTPVDEFFKNFSSGTLRVVPFSIGVNSWTLSNGTYSYTYPTEYVTATSVEFIEYGSSFRDAVRGDINAVKATGGGGVTFTTDALPVDTLTGEIRVFDSDDGKVAIVTQMTALPTIRDVPFTLAVSDWSLNGDGLYEAVLTTAFVTSTSHDFVEFDESIENATDGIKAIKAESSGSVVGMKFLSRRIPAGSISGTITPLDNADGKIAVALQDTVMPIANGGTGANTLAGAQENLGIAELTTNIENLTATVNTITSKLSKFVQIGYITSGTLPASADTNIDVTFNSEFDNVPMVMATVLYNTSYADRVSVITRIENITKTGCTLRVLNPYAADVSLTNTRRIVWLAIDN